MKNTGKLIALLGVLLLAAGCIDENRDDCPTEEPFNISLDFLLPDRKSNECIFMSEISAVDLHIYDDTEKLVLAKYITPEQLQEYQGVKLTLPAGTYNVVGWGNINDDCIFHDGEETGSPYDSNITYDPLGDRFGYTSGKVYYAPRSGAITRSGGMPECHTMNVDPETGYEGTLEFRPAHRIIKVYIEGYNGTPMIEFIGLPTGLTWLGMEQLWRDRSGITVAMLKTTEPHQKNGITYDYVEFDTFHFDGSSNIILEIVDPETLNIVYSALLNEIIEAIHDPDEIEISVLVKFTPGGVEISVPEWNREEVTPGVGV